MPFKYFTLTERQCKCKLDKFHRTKLLSISDYLYPTSRCSKFLHDIVKRGVAEYNEQSENPCYYYPVKVIHAFGYHTGCCTACSPKKYQITVTLGLTTIKKSNIKPKFIIFPSCFEADKSLREDIVISYIPKQIVTCSYTQEESLELESSLKDSKIVNKAVTKYNEQSSNSCYYYAAHILEANRIYSYVTKYNVKITLGLTTIKKSKIKPFFVLFPSCFEADKTFREDISIIYTPKQNFFYRNNIEEEWEFGPSLNDSIRGNKRLEYFSFSFNKENNRLIIRMNLILLICLVGISLACNLQSNKDIDGHDLSNQPGQVNDCCGICQSTSGCQAFSWTNYNGGTCWLKSAAGPVKDGADVTLGTLDGESGGGYSLQKTYAGDNFFDGFYFWNHDDATHGCVRYVDKETAQSLGLIGVENGKVKISADSSNIYGGNDGRPSVRIHSNDKYNEGLFIYDIDHMPVGPGTWPAYWFCGQDWPNNGEIDVLEGVDGNVANNQALHTNQNCYMPLDASIFKGHWAKGPGGKIANDCYVNAAGQSTNQGCSITSEDGYYGVPFNNAGGGIFAFEWNRESTLKIWIFKRNELPADINSGNPNPSNWGKPQAYFTIGSTCSANHFNNHEIIINLTFCGDWAGNVYPGGMAACNDKVRTDPGAFKDAYWLVNYLKYYSK